MAGRDLSGEAVVLRRPAGLRFLAAPPTAAHPLRSKYARRQRYSIEFIWRVARGVCHAMAHLHTHKVAHGQLYAHSVLVDGEVCLNECSDPSRLMSITTAIKPSLRLQGC